MRRSNFVLGILILAAGCSTTTSSSPAAVTPTAARSVDTATPAAASGPAAFEDAGSGPLRAGTYSLAYASIAGRAEYPTLSVQFTVPSGWEKVGIEGILWGTGARLGFAVPTNVFADPCDPEQGELDPPVGPTIDELTTALFELPGWEPGPFEWDQYLGFMGNHVTLTAPADMSECADPARIMRAPGWPGFIEAGGEGGQLEFWILNVAGTRLVIYTSTDAEASERVRAELASIFDSIRITS
ncbi:MAG TPA: hypothetical protein VF071_08765 [Candidatus Limnocylindria bacterium]